MSPQIRRRLVIFVLVPLIICGLAVLVTVIPYTKYTRGFYQLLVFALIADLAAGFTGVWRNVGTVIATTVFGLAVLELACAATEPDQAYYPRKFSTSQPILGWGPATPGVYHSFRRGKGRTLIYSVDYTIDDHLLRPTQSASAGPTVAFFGDSFIFGQGLPESETLPQIYADLTGRKVHVLNFGFPGYGPQQFLRAIETGLFNPLLTDTKLFVYETAAWHIERASCRAGFMARAPRYEMHNGIPIFTGACAQGLKRVFNDIIASGALYQRFILPMLNGVTADDVEIYIAEFARAAQLVKQKYGARLVILYLAGGQAFPNLADGATYLAKSGFTDVKIEARLREAGVDVIDAKVSPQSIPADASLAIPGDGHPSAAANRARAEMLKDYLARAPTTATAK